MVVNCPKCTQVIAKGFDSVEGPFDFKTKCPHCRAEVDVKFRLVLVMEATSEEVVRQTIINKPGERPLHLEKSTPGIRMI